MDLKTGRSEKDMYGGRWGVGGEDRSDWPRWKVFYRTLC